MVETTAKTLDITKKMLKAAGTCTAEELAAAALTCVQMACYLKSPVQWLEHIDKERKTLNLKGKNHD